MALGWPDVPISYRRLLDLAADPSGWGSVNASASTPRAVLDSWGALKLGHGHPKSSNSGRLSVVSALYAAMALPSNVSLSVLLADEHLAEGSEVLSELARFEGAVYHLGKVDTDLLDKMVMEGPDYLDAVSNYEGNVIRWNRNYAVHLRHMFNDSLVFIYPSDGTFIMNHPLCVLDDDAYLRRLHPDATRAERLELVQAAVAFQQFAVAPEQLAMLPQLGIRPHDPSIRLDLPTSLIDPAYGVDPTIRLSSLSLIPFPNDELLQRIVDSFVLYKRPSVVSAAFDTSDAMAGDSMRHAIRAAVRLACEMGPADALQLIQFGSVPKQLTGFEVLSSRRSEVIRVATAMQAGGGTALYCAINAGLQQLHNRSREVEALSTGHAANSALVVMARGVNSVGTGCSTVDEALLPQGLSPNEAHIFTIGIGSETAPEAGYLRELSRSTRGKYFDNRKVESLDSIYYEISCEF